MAKINIYTIFLSSWEKKNNPIGCPEDRISLPIWRTKGWNAYQENYQKEERKLLTAEEFQKILRNKYWNICKADQISCQSVANLLVDFYWINGSPAISCMQDVLGLPETGEMDDETIHKINGYEYQGRLFALYWAARKQYNQKVRIVTKIDSPEMDRLRAVSWGYLVKGDNDHTTIRWPY